MHGAQGMPHHVHARDRQHHTELRTGMFGMGFSEIVDAARESIQIFAKCRVLLLIPCLRAFGHAVGLHPAIEIELGRSPIFRPAPARFAVEAQKQVRMILHLRPAVGVKHRFQAVGKDVRHAVLIPENFRSWRRAKTAGEKQQTHEKATHDVS